MKTDRPNLQRVLDGGMQHILLMMFQQTEDLHIFTLPSLALTLLEQPLQR